MKKAEVVWLASKLEEYLMQYLEGIEFEIKKLEEKKYLECDEVEKLNTLCLLYGVSKSDLDILNGVKKGFDWVG